MWSAGAGHADVVSLLLADPRVDVNAKDRSGRTACHHACAQNRGAVVAILLAEPRADWGIKDKNGCWPWDASVGGYGASPETKQVVLEALATRDVVSRSNRRLNVATSSSALLSRQGSKAGGTPATASSNDSTVTVTPDSAAAWSAEAERELTAAVGSMGAAAERAESNSRELASKLAAEQSARMQLELDLETMRADKFALSSELAQLKEAVTVKDDQLAQLKSELDGLKNERELHLADKESFVAVESALASVTKTLQSERESISALAEENAELAKDKSDLEAAKHGLEEQLSSLRALNKTVLDQVAALREEKDGLTLKGVGMIAERDELVRERDALLGERDGLKKERDELNGETLNSISQHGMTQV